MLMSDPLCRVHVFGWIQAVKLTTKIISKYTGHVYDIEIVGFSVFVLAELV
jgi:hypothetical protein